MIIRMVLSVWEEPIIGKVRWGKDPKKRPHKSRFREKKAFFWLPLRPSLLYVWAMLLLINTNRMIPPIAPVGLDYVACAAREAGIETQVLDLCMVDDPHRAIAECLANVRPELIAVTIRNTDDCFWPSGAWFVPDLQQTLNEIRRHTDAPVVLGGAGFSIFAQQVMERTNAEFGIHGDGEQAIVGLMAELQGSRCFEKVAGLLWRNNGHVQANLPAWHSPLKVPTRRNAFDNRTYFRLGGQVGVETKRGCARQCAYCADPLAKGSVARVRNPSEVADEFQALLDQGIDVLHLCDAEFNLPLNHAMAVCDELIRRDLGSRVRWYAYLAVVPLDIDLVGRMRRAGCVGINFTSDSANTAMLNRYRQPHRQEDISKAVRFCRKKGIAVMLDLLLGGPGETPETLAESIRFFKAINPDCVGAGLGLRIYPGTTMEHIIAAEGPMEANPSIRRHYTGPIDLLQPTFYIASTLGERPAQLVNDLIAGDPRFFPPEDEFAASQNSGDHNYNANQPLCDAIANGARGAYWDILRKLRNPDCCPCSQ
jgi:radical SAM superfamily enzyme YgiQ (UPF0313 family)